MSNIGRFFMIAPDTEKYSLHYIIKELGITKFIFFKRHTQNLKKLIDTISEIKYLSYPIEPLIAVDEEGGLVSRLSHIIGKLPGSMALANCGKDLIYDSVYSLSRSIMQLGFNLNFMPVLDILGNYINKCISIRAYGYDYLTIRDTASIVVRAMKDSGIFYCYKHFPGLGKATVDSHYSLPVIYHDIFSLNDDIKVYADLLSLFDHNFIMTAHGLYPGISDGICTFSKEIITDLLKKQMGFKGIVTSDDLLMGALNADGNIRDRALKAFNAGIDLLLVCRLDDAFMEMYHVMEKAFLNNKIKEKRLLDAEQRMAYVLGNKKPPLSFNPQKSFIPKIIIRKIYSKLCENILKPPVNSYKRTIFYIPEEVDSFSPVIEKTLFRGKDIKKTENFNMQYYSIKEGINIQYPKDESLYIIFTINPLYNTLYKTSLKRLDKILRNFYIISMGEPQERTFIQNAISILNLYSVCPEEIFKDLLKILDMNLS